MSINTIHPSELLPTQFVLPNRKTLDTSQRGDQEVSEASPSEQKRSSALNQKALAGQSTQRFKREADRIVGSSLESPEQISTNRSRLFTPPPWDEGLPSYPKFEADPSQWWQNLWKNKEVLNDQLIQYGYTSAENFLASKQENPPGAALPRKMNPKEEVEEIIKNKIRPVTDYITWKCAVYKALIERSPDKKNIYAEEFQAEMDANLPGWKTYMTQEATKATKLINNQLRNVEYNTGNRWFRGDSRNKLAWAWTRDQQKWLLDWNRKRLPESEQSVNDAATQATRDVVNDISAAITQAHQELLASVFPDQAIDAAPTIDADEIVIG